jgi:hypothetical protein
MTHFANVDLPLGSSGSPAIIQDVAPRIRSPAISSYSGLLPSSADAHVSRGLSPPIHNIVGAAPIMPQGWLHLTPADLPMNSSSKGALHKFKGEADDVNHFLDEYEQLFRLYHLISDTDHCKYLQRYISKTVWDELCDQPAVVNPDWDNLKKVICQIYNVDGVEYKYSHKDLRKFVLKSARTSTPLDSMDKYCKYQCKYLVIANFLYSHGRIDREVLETHFFLGIPKKQREGLQREVRNMYPKHKTNVPYCLTQLDKAAQELFRKDHFDIDALDLYSDFSKEEESESDSNDSDSESEEEKPRTWSHKPKKETNHFRRQGCHPYGSDESDEEETDDKEGIYDCKSTSKIKTKVDKSSQSGRSHKTPAVTMWSAIKVRTLHTPAESQRITQELEAEGKCAAQLDAIDTLVMDLSGMQVSDSTYVVKLMRLRELALKMVKPILEHVSQCSWEQRPSFSSAIAQQCQERRMWGVCNFVLTMLQDQIPHH